MIIIYLDGGTKKIIYYNTFMNIFKKIVRIFALYSKKRALHKKLRQYSNTSVSTNVSKTIITEGADVTLNSKSIQMIEQVRDSVNNIVKQCNCEPEKLLDYVKMSKTKVYRILSANKILKYINEEEGFIPEQNGLNALILSVMTRNGINLKTKPLFIFSSKTPEKYLVLYNFYKWYSMKSGLPGFEYKTQKLFKKYYKNNSKAVTSKFTLDEIVALQNAIARDSEAAEFALNYEKQTDVSKKLSDKISNDGGANI